jgi:hypothetical protein
MVDANPSLTLYTFNFLFQETRFFLLNMKTFELQQIDLMGSRRLRVRNRRRPALHRHNFKPFFHQTISIHNSP